MRNKAGLLAAIILSSATVQAQAALDLRDGWFRALPPSLPSGAYFTLRNGGSKAVTLTGANSPACGMLMLHRSENQGGMGTMTGVSAAEVPAGGELRFAPGGYHLMCMDAKPVLKPGARVPVTLTFRDAPPLTAQFDVRNAAGK